MLRWLAGVREASYLQKPVCLSALQARLRWALGVPFPLAGQLHQEVGLALLSGGLIGEAMEIFEALGLWERLLVCYRLLGKQPQALQLVQKRLQVRVRACTPLQVGSCANIISGCLSCSSSKPPVVARFWSLAHRPSSAKPDRLF